MKLKKIKVTSDSTCDLPEHLLQTYHIDIFPQYIIKDGHPYKDTVEITPADIFSYTEQSGKLCSTASVNSYDYGQVFSDLSKQYDAVIHIGLGSNFSGCCQNARAAAADFDNVFVVDSRNMSLGQGLIVLEAAKRAEQGMSPERICDEVTALTDKVDASFILDRLDYIVKGGRCSALAALGANLLKLKPCIEVADGELRICKKYRGSFSKCVTAYIADRLSDSGSCATERIFVHNAAVEEETVALAEETVRKCASFENVTMAEAGCAISCHCGPHTLGIFFLRRD